YLYTVVSISRSQCAGQKNIAKSGAGTQNRIEVAGKKNAALFEWAAFVKAEKESEDPGSYGFNRTGG
ncbi:hypothetical protein, partial [Escherichia coli]|uniref:hypothetical protein n=1 Tax=Escherichia coli TaxID=562 RepID=UPI003EE15627